MTGTGTIEIIEVERPAVERSPADVLRLVVAGALVVALVLLGRFFGNTIVTFVGDLLTGVQALPQWLLDGVLILTRIITAVVLLAGAFAVIWKHRLRLFLMAAGGALGGALVSGLLVRLLDDTGTTLVKMTTTIGPLTSEHFPSQIGLAVAAGGVTASAPWLSRRWRRLAWTMIVALTISRFLTAPVSLDSAIAILSGWLAGSALLVAVGGPLRRPEGQAIADGLASVGVDLTRLEQANVDARGSTPYFGKTAAGDGMFVKVLGEDERNADLLFRLYRRIQPRDLGDEKAFSSLRRSVEHEALVSLMARNVGVPTPRVVAFAMVEPKACVLVYETIEGTSLDRVDPATIDDAMLDALWGQIRQLREHRIAHRDLRLANLFLGADGKVMLIDFGFSELAASDLLLATDLAELLASLSLAIGAERSVESARRVIGPDVASALPRLEPFALSGASRTGLKSHPQLLADVRRLVAAERQTPTENEDSS